MMIYHHFACIICDAILYMQNGGILNEGSTRLCNTYIDKVVENRYCWGKGGGLNFHLIPPLMQDD